MKNFKNKTLKDYKLKNYQNDEGHVDVMVVALPGVIKRLQDWNDNLTKK